MLRTVKASVSPRMTRIGVVGSYPASINARHRLKTGLELVSVTPSAVAQ
jgi:hypothetical protein